MMSHLENGPEREEKAMERTHSFMIPELYRDVIEGISILENGGVFIKWKNPLNVHLSDGKADFTFAPLLLPNKILMIRAYDLIESQLVREGR